MRTFLKIISLSLILIFFICGCNPAEQRNETSSLTTDFADSSSKDINLSQESVASDTNTVLQEYESTDSSSSKVQSVQNSSVLSEESKINESVVESSSFVSSVSKPKAPQNVKSKGIDVSKWQGIIDWKAVKSSGIDFAIIRIGYRGENGEISKDECADYNIQQAIKNNVLVGVYFFSTAISKSEAKQEAEWTAKAIKSYPISYPVVYDCEGYSKDDSRMNGLTNSERTDNALAFLSQIEKLGYKGMFYSSATEMENSLNWEMSRIEEKYKVWVAYYPDITYPDIKNPVYSGKYDMWQYTSSGTVSGVEGNADMVVSYFSVKKATAKSSKKPPVASVPQIKDDVYSDAFDTVTAKDIVNLRDSDSTKANVVGSLKNGETLKRIAKGSNGWSKLEYKGKTVYAITSYLTDDLSFKPQLEDDGFKKVTEKVTAKSETNLRSVPNSSDASTIIYTLKNGETAKRVGISDSGWSKVIYKGETLYAVTSYLTTDLKYKPPVESNNQSTEEKGMQFENVYENVTAKSETNLRREPSSKSDDTIVYTLKNGEYVTRTGVSDSGWSRLLYKGETVYAVTSFLTK